jgi:hypothetical protein
MIQEGEEVTLDGFKGELFECSIFEDGWSFTSLSSLVGGKLFIAVTRSQIVEFGPALLRNVAYCRSAHDLKNLSRLKYRKGETITFHWSDGANSKYKMKECKACVLLVQKNMGKIGMLGETNSQRVKKELYHDAMQCFSQAKELEKKHTHNLTPEIITQIASLHREATEKCGEAGGDGSVSTEASYKHIVDYFHKFLRRPEVTKVLDEGALKDDALIYKPHSDGSRVWFSPPGEGSIAVTEEGSATNAHSSDFEESTLHSADLELLRNDLFDSEQGDESNEQDTSALADITPSESPSRITELQPHVESIERSGRIMLENDMRLENDELDFDFKLSSGTIEFWDGEVYEAVEQDTNSEKNDLDFIWASTSDITSISAADHSPTTATEAPNSSMAMSPQDILLAGDGSLDDTAKKPSDSSDGEKKEEADFIEGLNKLTLEFEIILGKSEPT